MVVEYNIMFSVVKCGYLPLLIFLATISTAHAQEDTGYRIELLVLRHLESFAVPMPLAELPDLSGLLDLPARARAKGEPDTLPEDPFYLGPSPSELPPPMGLFSDQLGARDGIAFLEERSERMDAVWRNLRLSAEFRPEVFFAWEQPAEGPFPELRVHNEEIIWIEDHHAAIRSSRSSYMFHYEVASGELAMAPIPSPVYHYALDGSASLRRSRFLHFDLDISFRSLAPGAEPGIAGPPLRNAQSAFQVHELRQSRQIRTGRMEYFDSPVLGALLWVSEIDWNKETTE